MDIKIGLLVKNRITLEVSVHNSRVGSHEWFYSIMIVGMKRFQRKSFHQIDFMKKRFHG